MKKLLLATTALAASAGLAHAQSGISVSAGVEMGISKTGDADAKFHQNTTIGLAGTAVTDAGLTFGFTAEITGAYNEDEIDGPADLGSEDVTVSGAFGSLTLGNTDGSFDWAMTEVGIGGAINDDHTAHDGYSGNGGIDHSVDDQVLRYDNSFGDIGIAVSLELKDGDLGKNNFGIGARYSMAMGDGTNVSFGAGYGSGSRIVAGAETPHADPDGADNIEGDVVVIPNPPTAGPIAVTNDDNAPTVGANTAADADIWGVSVSADLANGLTTVLNYSNGWQGGVGADESHTALGLAYSIDAVTVSANYGKYGSGENGFGFALNYSLGLGATAQLGYGRGEDDEGKSTSRWSAGVGMSF